MCGIAGVFYFKDKENLNFHEDVINKLKHRGPDEFGLYSDEHIDMMHTRLSIIDLESGKQPIFNESKDKVIVFNGEIYNYRELRDKLLEKGYKFKTKTDTEVILNSFEEWGKDSLSYIKGMFSFAIWDKKKQSLFLARDRMGEKPLFYYRDEEKIIFASEIKAILQFVKKSFQINKEALQEYLSLTYVPAPLTIFDGIYKLEASCFMEVTRESAEIEKYWDLKKLNNNKVYFKNYEECKKEVREKLFNSVENMLHADVEVGAFLSGGIDSSIVVGAINKVSNKKTNTFSIGYKNKNFDESDRAKIVSDFNNTNHTMQILEYNNISENLEDLLLQFDEPFADSSAIPTYYVSKLASEKVKVVLTGDGGDELFGGYSKYLINYYMKKYKKVPKSLRKGIKYSVDKFMPENNLKRKILKVSNLEEYDESVDLYLNLTKLGFKENELKNLLLEDRTNIIDEKIRELYTSVKGSDLEKSLFVDQNIILEGDMLTKVDRMSMKNSIETRVPFLDKDLLEVSLRVPENYKIKGHDTKFILKDAFSDILPKGIVNKSKMGFAVPIGEWMRKEFKDEICYLLSKEFLTSQKIFNVEYVIELLNEHMERKKDNSSKIWTIYVFQKWYVGIYEKQ